MWEELGTRDALVKGHKSETQFYKWTVSGGSDLDCRNFQVNLSLGGLLSDFSLEIIDKPGGGEGYDYEAGEDVINDVNGVETNTEKGKLRNWQTWPEMPVWPCQR